MLKLMLQSSSPFFPRWLFHVRFVLFSGFIFFPLFICIKCWLLALYSCGDASLHFRWFLHCLFFFFFLLCFRHNFFSLAGVFFSRTVVRSNCLFCAHSMRSNVKIHDRNRKRERIKNFAFFSVRCLGSGCSRCVSVSSSHGNKNTSIAAGRE